VIEVKLYFPEYQQQKANLNYSKNNDYVRPVIKSGAGGKIIFLMLKWNIE
jgi:hypothetical protein